MCSDCRARLPCRHPTCWRCNSLSNNWRVCRSCRRDQGPRAVIAPCSYQEVAATLVASLKFKHARAAAKAMSREMAAYTDASYYGVTFVPTAKKRVRQRGYDQAELLARSLAHELKLPCYRLLHRTGSSRQVGSSRQQRQKQAAMSYKCNANLSGKQILLVDDVISTGATVYACSKLLRRQGAKHVDVVVFALRR